jgi:hypothetical protein
MHDTIAQNLNCNSVDLRLQKFLVIRYTIARFADDLKIAHNSVNGARIGAEVDKVHTADVQGNSVARLLHVSDKQSAITARHGPGCSG